MADFYIKQNDTAPKIKALLKDATGAPVAMGTVDEVRFNMRKLGDTLAKVDAVATVTNSLTAEVEYAWQAGDTDDAGTFYAEWEVHYNDGTELSVPNARTTAHPTGYLEIEILGELA